VRIICAGLFIGACVLLWIGGGMLFLVPGYPGEGYWAVERVKYGIVPAAAALSLLAAVGWLWTRSGSPLTLRNAIQRSISLAIGACVLFYFVMAFIAAQRQG
jgi:hypothetical protein